MTIYINSFNVRDYTKARTRHPIVKCFKNKLFFNKSAADLIQAPVRVSFALTDDILTVYEDNLGFDIVMNQNGFFIHNKALITRLEELINKENPFFLLNKTNDEKTFELKLIENGQS